LAFLGLMDKTAKKVHEEHRAFLGRSAPRACRGFKGCRASLGWMVTRDKMGWMGFRGQLVHRGLRELPARLASQGLKGLRA